MEKKAGTLVVTALGPDVTNEGRAAIEAGCPYMVLARFKGTTDIIFHRWSVEGIEEKARAAKGSKAKKTDDLESYVWRNDRQELCIPGEYFRQSVINAAKYRQDPRSPRKSAMDLYKAGIMSLTDLASLGVVTWDYEDARRVQVQRNGVTRVRPAIKKGWEVEVEFLVNLPEYIPSDALLDVLVNAGRLVGVADNRPTYGRFAVVKYEPVRI